MIDSYRIQYGYFVDRGNPEFKAPWNQIRNLHRVFTPQDKAVQTPNSDTPYSTLAWTCAPSPWCLQALTKPLEKPDKPGGRLGFVRAFYRPSNREEPILQRPTHRSLHLQL